MTPCKFRYSFQKYVKLNRLADGPLKQLIESRLANTFFIGFVACSLYSALSIFGCADILPGTKGIDLIVVIVVVKERKEDYVTHLFMYDSTVHNM